MEEYGKLTLATSSSENTIYKSDLNMLPKVNLEKMLDISKDEKVLTILLILLIVQIHCLDTTWKCTKHNIFTMCNIVPSFRRFSKF